MSVTWANIERVRHFGKFGGWFITRLYILGGLTTLVSIGGCAAIQGFPDRTSPTKDQLASLAPYMSATALVNYDAADPSQRNGMSREEWRNEVLEARIQDINLHFGDFEQQLYEQGVGFGVGTDWVSLALTSLASLNTGGAAQALSAAATGVTGASASYNKDALYGKTLQVMMSQMIAQRQTILVRIRLGELLPSVNYPLTRGLSDLDDYYSAGTVPGSLAALAASAGTQTSIAQTNLKDIMLVTPVSVALQVRRENTATYVKSLTQTQQDTLATALGQPTGPDALKEILQEIAKATTDVDLNAIAGHIKTLFGKGDL